jgi:hypothetical protein
MPFDAKLPLPSIDLWWMPLWLEPTHRESRHVSVEISSSNTNWSKWLYEILTPSGNGWETVASRGEGNLVINRDFGESGQVTDNAVAEPRQERR